MGVTRSGESKEVKNTLDTINQIDIFHKSKEIKPMDYHIMKGETREFKFFSPGEKIFSIDVDANYPDRHLILSCDKSEELKITIWNRNTDKCFSRFLNQKQHYGTYFKSARFLPLAEGNLILFEGFGALKGWTGHHFICLYSIIPFELVKRSKIYANTFAIVSMDNQTRLVVVDHKNKKICLLDVSKNPLDGYAVCSINCLFPEEYVKKRGVFEPSVKSIKTLPGSIPRLAFHLIDQKTRAEFIRIATVNLSTYEILLEECIPIPRTAAGDEDDHDCTHARGIQNLPDGRLAHFTNYCYWPNEREREGKKLNTNRISIFSVENEKWQLAMPYIFNESFAYNQEWNLLPYFQRKEENGITEIKNALSSEEKPSISLSAKCNLFFIPSLNHTFYCPLENFSHRYECCEIVAINYQFLEQHVALEIYKTRSDLPSVLCLKVASYAREIGMFSPTLIRAGSRALQQKAAAVQGGDVLEITLKNHF